MAVDPSLSRDITRQLKEALGAKKKLFCPPLRIVTEKANRGKEIQWGKTRVLLKDKLGSVHFNKVVVTSEVGVGLLAAYIAGVKLTKKQAKQDSK